MITDRRENRYFFWEQEQSQETHFFLRNTMAIRLRELDAGLKGNFLPPMAWPSTQGGYPLAKQRPISQKDMKRDTKISHRVSCRNKKPKELVAVSSKKSPDGPVSTKN